MFHKCLNVFKYKQHLSILGQDSLFGPLFSARHTIPLTSGQMLKVIGDLCLSVLFYVSHSLR